MIDLITFTPIDCPTREEGAKMLKTQFRDNEDRFIDRWLNPVKQWLMMNDVKKADKIVDFLLQLWRNATPYTYKEAFNLPPGTFRNLVFSVINVPEMIKNLGHKRISTKGIKLNNELWDEMRQKFVTTELYQIYELHEVDFSSISRNNDVTYAIKCWCTSTNNEHWLFTPSGKNPLEAIASTCVVYKPMLGKITKIIRQGDVFLFEMSEEVEISEEDETVSLDANTYFKLLSAQS